MARFAKGAITHWRSTGVTALISTVLGYSVSNSYKHTTQLQSQPGPQLLTRSSVADAVESAGSSVVGVRVAPPGYSRLARSGGSGFVLSDGVVVSCNSSALVPFCFWNAAIPLPMLEHDQ